MITIQIPYKDSSVALWYTRDATEILKEPSADSSTLQGGEGHCGSRLYLCLPTQNDGKTAQKYVEISLVLKETWLRPLGYLTTEYLPEFWRDEDIFPLQISFSKDLRQGFANLFFISVQMRTVNVPVPILQCEPDSFTKLSLRS